MAGALAEHKRTSRYQKTALPLSTRMRRSCPLMCCMIVRRRFEVGPTARRSIAYLYDPGQLRMPAVRSAHCTRSTLPPARAPFALSTEACRGAQDQPQLDDGPPTASSRRRLEEPLHFFHYDGLRRASPSTLLGA